MVEEKFMHRAIDLAYRAEAQSISPNPRVGAVLEYHGRVIGEGYHCQVGSAHAEINCLASVRDCDRHLIPHSTMYVTLEPCAHEGRTPSCAVRLVRERVRRVIVGTEDPFPLVTGKGIGILREGGIEVFSPFLEDECRELAKVFLTNQNLHRPFITLKWAESIDGFLDRVRESDAVPPMRLSSPFTQMLVHRQRSMSSAILVGRRTYDLDHPTLTNRFWLLNDYSPKPILLSSGAPAEQPEPWMRMDQITENGLRSLLEDGGITSLLVEGGAVTHKTFLDLGFWDEIHREVSPVELQSGVPALQMPSDARCQSDQIIDGHRIERWRRVY